MACQRRNRLYQPSIETGGDRRTSEATFRKAFPAYAKGVKDRGIRLSSTDPERRSVIVYRDALLPPSQTFIQAQAGAMQRFRVVFAGSRSVPGGLDLGAPSSTLQSISSSSLAMICNEARFKILRNVPGRWLADLARHSPALIHAHFGPDAVFSTAISEALAVPLVATFHGYDITMRPSSSLPFALYSTQLRRLFRRAGLIIAISKFIQGRLLDRGCPPGKVLVHYIGVDTKFFSARQEERETIILFVGRLVEKKGGEDLIRAMAIVNGRIPQLRLVIVGDGPLRSRLEALAASLRVSAEFVGSNPREEVRAWMNRASVFCGPSREVPSGDAEGLGLVFLEAQSMGLPVVSTFHGGIPEAVCHEETGILVSPGNIEQLAAAIIRLGSSRSLRDAMGDRGRSFVRSSFDLATQTLKLEEHYDQMLSATSQQGTRNPAGHPKLH
jgi:colanic acid/amylovoran biosynthesis glycosyltransferase